MLSAPYRCCGYPNLAMMENAIAPGTTVFALDLSWPFIGLQQGKIFTLGGCVGWIV